MSIDDDDDDDLVQERKAIAQENMEPLEDDDTEEYTETKSSIPLSPEFCLLCNVLFENEMQFKEHQMSGYHQNQAIFYGEYQRAKEISGFDHYMQTLWLAMMECQQQGLSNIYIDLAYMVAENLFRHCASIDYATQQTRNWQAGAHEIYKLSIQLKSASTELLGHMNYNYQLLRMLSREEMHFNNMQFS